MQGRCLVNADGATSRLATELGYCTEAPKGICSRAFVEGGTHNTTFDGAEPSSPSLFDSQQKSALALKNPVPAGVCFYQRESLPGYSAIFRHPNDELNFCYYLLPCRKDGMCGSVKVCLNTPPVLACQ